ncbi:TGB2 [Babaco mosaic virus]|uniref:TGB2 n=1 Tax=Babaco mosaic virus TaxID=2060511 RepID=A0A2H4ZU41_9VIRU|nr:TGB2 [Babaco mosaic virus]AUG45970.1 TGB2 [Babaco mosaic virus]
MSELPRSLTPPSDNSSAILAVAVGIGLALFTFTLLSYKLPVPGDNIHSLPFGGYYRDGTKSISYNSPRSQASASKSVPALLVLALVAAIYGITWGDKNRARGVRACPCHLHSPQ